MNRVVRRFGSFLLAATMVVALSACSTSSNQNSSGSSGGAAPQEKVTLTYWNINTADPQKTMNDNIVKKWNSDHPNIQVMASATENDAYKTKIKTAISANQAPDIIYSWTLGFTQPFVEAGKILALDSYLDAATKAKLLPGALTNVTYSGKVYGLTYAQQAGALYINTDLFKKYNVKVPTTFDELLSAVKTFKANNVKPMALGEKDEWPGMWYYDMIALRTAGLSTCTNALTGKASFTDPGFSDAANDLLELINAGAFESGVMGLTRDEVNAAFCQGQYAMYFGGNFEAAQYDADNSAVKGKIEAVRFPTISGGKGADTEYLGGGTDCLLVSANTKYKTQAVQATEYIAEQLSTQGFVIGANLPEWKYDSIDVSKIDPLTQEIMKNVISGSTGSVPAWDIFLTGDKAQTHKDLVAELFGKEITGTDFASQMQSKLNS